VLVAAGQAATAGVVSTEVLALTEGVMKTMLLSKLKGLWAVALVVAVTTTAGLTYRAVAQEAAKVRVGTALTARQAPDELEALRLEIEALRKEMRAMRERMKTLETKVQGQAPPPSASVPVLHPLLAAPPRPARTYFRIDDPLADAEAALQKLRQNPGDKQAAEALEQALKRLREQRKPNQPAQPGNVSPPASAR
jgi:hypothetical protein